MYIAFEGKGVGGHKAPCWLGPQKQNCGHPHGVFLGLECFGKLTKNQESGERDTFSSLSDMLTTLLTGRNCGNCGETQNLISNMSQTRQKRAKPNLKHKFPFAPRVNVSLYLY